ncbi:MAG: biotin/lipoyl-containing protein [Bryobacteraceae bacterium]
MKLKITVDNKTYEVEVEAEESEVVHAPAAYRPVSWSAPSAPAPVTTPAGGASSGNGEAVDESKVCRSPMVGVVVRLNAQEGQAVKVDDSLLVLEAMKMETTITSPVAGKIKRVRVGAGQSVQANQVLVDFE